MRPVFEIVGDPQGQTYIQLLEFAASRCDSFSLVWRDQLQFEQSAYEIKKVLESYLLSNAKTDEWPGTKLIGHKAMVGRYRVTKESINFLSVSGSLHSWLRPKLPEDLAFYDSGDMVWLASISHEQLAWFFDESLRPTEIYAYVPQIKIRESKDW